MAPVKQRLKTHELVFLYVMALSLFYAYGHFWQSKRKTELAKLNQELTLAKEEAEKDRQTLEKLAPANRNTAVLSPQTEFSKDLLDKYAKSNDRFSKIMAQLADKSGTPFALTRFVTEKQTKVGSFIRTSIDLEAQATFLTIGRFLETLDNSPLLTEVDSIEINRVPNDLKLCNTKIRLFSYMADPRQ